MTTAEKIASAKSTIYFTLFKEGIFYKCYNEDAMVFVTRVKPYKVSATYVKNVGEEVYCVGFPVEFLLKYGKNPPLVKASFPHYNKILIAITNGTL